MDYCRVVQHVGADERELAGELLEVHVAEPASECGLGLAPARERHPGDGVVAERVSADELLVAGRVDGRGVLARRIEGGNDAADAAAGDPVDLLTGCLQLVQHADGGERSGAASGEGDAERLPGEAGGDPADGGCELWLPAREDTAWAGGVVPGEEPRSVRGAADEHDVARAFEVQRQRRRVGVRDDDEPVCLS